MILSAPENEEMGRCVVKLINAGKDLRIKVANLTVLEEKELETVLHPRPKGG